MNTKKSLSEESRLEEEMAEAIEAYYKRFGKTPPLSTDGGPTPERILHAALVGVEVSPGGGVKDEEA